jgi:hypothetical protein
MTAPKKWRRVTDKMRERMVTSLKTQCGRVWVFGGQSYFCLRDDDHPGSHDFLVSRSDADLDMDDVFERAWVKALRARDGSAPAKARPRSRRG